MGLEERVCSEPDEIHGKDRIRVQPYKLPVKSSIVSFGSIQQAEPLLPVRPPERQPFIKLLQRNIKAFTELFCSVEPGKVFAQDKKDEEQAVARIRDNDIREDGMGMRTAVAEHAHDAELLLMLPAGPKVNDGSAVISVDVAVSGASTDWTGLQFGLKLRHVGIKKRF